MLSVVIENDVLKAEIKARGAELTSLFLKNEGKEWLWQADAKYWGKHAPVLFPVIGCMKNGQYEMDEKVYPMTKHGFARDYDFELVEQSETRVLWRFSGNPETEMMYPFNYDLEIGYELKERSIAVTYEVINQSETDGMWFSIGGHPAFNVDLSKGGWRLIFEKPETLSSLQVDLSSGLILPNKKPLVKEPVTVFPLNLDLFKEDALIFEGLHSKWVQLVDGDDGTPLTFHFEGFPLLALWTPEAPFLCIEPWYGLADAFETDGNIANKKGIRLLAPGAQFSCTYEISL